MVTMAIEIEHDHKAKTELLALLEEYHMPDTKIFAQLNLDGSGGVDKKEFVAAFDEELALFYIFHELDA